MKTPSTGKRSRSVSRGRSRTRRKLSFSGSSRGSIASAASVLRGLKSKSRSRSSSKFSHVGNEAMATNERTAVVLKKGKPMVGKSLRPKKHVKISKSFKTKVNQLLEVPRVHGYYQETTAFYLNFIGAANNGKQKVGAINGTGSGLNSGICFNPARLLNVASVLFNKKTATANSQWAEGGAATNYNFGVNTFDSNLCKINVKKQWVDVEFRNNTNRTFKMKLFDCVPKVHGGVITLQAPQTSWGAALDKLATVGVANNQPQNCNGEIASPTLQTTLFADPRKVKTWNQYWKCQVTEVVVEPGQTFTWVVNGPALEYDFSKYYSTDGGLANTVFNDYVKNVTHSLFAVFYPELGLGYTGAAQGGVGRFGGATPVLPNVTGILYEVKYHYEVDMPDQAGFYDPIALPASTPIQLGLRRNVFFQKNWGDNDTSTNINGRVEEETGLLAIPSS